MSKCEERDEVFTLMTITEYF